MHTLSSLNTTPKPKWLKAVIPSGEKYHFIKNKRTSLKLATVCEEAYQKHSSEKYLYII